jgi:WhiB family redox-sensing transcriptional regulator
MPWLALAACLGEPLETFYPAQGNGSFDAARAICARCEVLEDCRRQCDRAEAGPSITELHGMFAGESPKERAARRRRR